jgi:hypothetical protein
MCQECEDILIETDALRHNFHLSGYLKQLVNSVLQNSMGRSNQRNELGPFC